MANRSTLDLSIIVPCRNEEENLELLLSRTDAAFHDTGIHWEIILIDDGSTDGTWSKISELEEKLDNARGIKHEVNKGIPGGWKPGVTHARGRYVRTTDADLQYLPEDFPRLYQTLREKEARGVDIVQGKREEHSKANSLRLALSMGFSIMLNLLFGMNLKDIKSGFLVMKREIFIDVLDYKTPYRHFQHLVTISAFCKGYHILQVPVLFDERHAGESNISRPLAFSLDALRDLPAAFLEFRINRTGRKKAKRSAASDTQSAAMERKVE